MRTILALLMALILTFAPSAALAAPENAAAPDRLSVCLLQPAVVPEPRTDGFGWEDVEYVPLDPDSFYEALEEFSALAEEGNGQAVAERYDGLCLQLENAYTQSTVAYIAFSGDVEDPYWLEENLSCQTLYTQMEDRMLTACHQVTEGPCALSFAAHVGDTLTELFQSYAPMSEREEELLEQEAELVNQYYEKMNSAGEASYVYQGESWNLDRITGEDGSALAERNYDDYLEVFYGIQQAVCSQVDTLFCDLVQIRRELAAMYGYASYSDFAYEQTYGRDYTAAQAQQLCEDVKPIARSYYNLVYNSPAPESGAAPLGEEELLPALEKGLQQLDPALGETWQYLQAHQLLDLGYGEPRMAASYTTYLPEYGFPFIFSTLYDDILDLTTLVHEFGHFAGYMRHPPASLFYGDGSYDLMEIHSTGLEALFTFCYGELYPQAAEEAKQAVLEQLLESVIEGCIFDELQRTVYERPDMTGEDISLLYGEICTQYGIYEPMGPDYGWVYVSHNFDSPFYYISYAASALAAIQIWDAAREDLARGVELWEEILEHDGFTESYGAVLRSCGLRTFTEEGAVREICTPLLNELGSTLF